MFCGLQNTPKCVPGWGSAPDPAGELTRLPRPSRGRGTSPSIPTLLGADYLRRSPLGATIFGEDNAPKIFYLERHEVDHFLCHCCLVRWQHSPSDRLHGPTSPTDHNISVPRSVHRCLSCLRLPGRGTVVSDVTV